MGNIFIIFINLMATIKYVHEHKEKIWSDISNQKSGRGRVTVFLPVTSPTAPWSCHSPQASLAAFSGCGPSHGSVTHTLVQQPFPFVDKCVLGR